MDTICRPHAVRCGSRPAFTLVELLVVIAIIAILAAVLFPVFVRTREAAVRGACQTHQHELHAALMMYLDDYGLLPWMQFLTWREVPGVGMLRLYHPYVRNDAIVLCPCRTWVRKWQQALNQSYAYNECLCGPLDYAAGFMTGTEAYWITSFPGKGRQLADIRHHARTPVFFDAFPYHLNPHGQRNGWGWQPWDAFNPERMTNPHSGGSNYAFLDGHVSWMLPAGPGIYVAIKDIDYDGNGTFGTDKVLR